ncbi:LINE-1 retrotransposable element ORF1 protein [Plecturocebus cupreus]
MGEELPKAVRAHLSHQRNLDMRHEVEEDYFATLSFNGCPIGFQTCIKPIARDRSSSSAREQGLMEDECDELTESDYRRWIIRNFCELKEHVLTQCKETKNLERRFNEMLTRMDNLEKNISELMELKNTTRELLKHAQVSTAELTKQKKGYQRSKINSMK